MKPVENEIILHLRPVSRPGQPPMPNRLRGLLKTALRSYEFRCTSVSEAPRGAGNAPRVHLNGSDDPEAE